MRRVLSLSVTCAMLALGACAHVGPPPSPHARLGELSEAFWDLEMERAPTFATFLGDRRFDDKLPDLSPSRHQAELTTESRLLDAARALSPSSLSGEDVITREVLITMLEDELGTELCHAEWWTVSQLDGPQTALGELPELHGITTVENARSLVRRYQASGTFIDQQIANLQHGQAEGYLAAKVSVQRVLDQLDQMLSTKPEESPQVTTVELPKSFSEKDQATLRAELVAATRDVLYPALARYRDFLRAYLPKAREQVGISALPHGAECYRARARATTGLDLAPEEIHRIGLAQVEEIDRQVREIALRVVGSDDVAKLKATLSDDPAQHVKTREELIAYSAALVKRTYEVLPKLFGHLPAQKLEVKPIEPFREQQAPMGYYYAGSQTEGRPGYFYLNTFEPQKTPVFLLQPLAFHEGVPGHHLQGAIAQENPDLPRFRRELGNDAYIEGWAHYAERLADELGLYQGDAGRYGMLSDQALRAVRLVVDTGMHVLGWDRQKALDYMLAHTAEPKDDAAREIDRYIVWPGQALAYKLGQLELFRLRHLAEKAQGEKFDVRAFHDEVLRHGAVPLPVLDAIIDRYLAAKH